VLVVLAVVLLSGGGGGSDGNTAKNRAKASPTAKAKASPTAEKTSTPEATQTATASPTASATAQAPSGGGQDLSKARQLQVAGYNARLGGDYAKDLDLSQQALDACGNSNEMDPCGYAMFEKGLSLNRSGRPDEAIPVLQERLDRFGDNEKGEVAKELKAAKKAAKG